MPMFLVISRHSPENCPMFNEEARKLWLEYISKFDELVKTHGIKRLGGWVVPTEHLSVGVFDAPSLEAFQSWSMEPLVLAFGAYETYEVKLAFSLEELGQMLKQF